MTRTEKENLVPVWERITISLEEAAAYSGIGVRKLRDMTDKPECNYVIWVGNRRMIKRKKFDEYLESAYSVCKAIWACGTHRRRKTDWGTDRCGYPGTAACVCLFSKRH